MIGGRNNHFGGCIKFFKEKHYHPMLREISPRLVISNLWSMLRSEHAKVQFGLLIMQSIKDVGVTSMTSIYFKYPQRTTNTPHSQDMQRLLHHGIQFARPCFKKIDY